MDSLAPRARVRRGGAWTELESKELVPGDIVAFKYGQIIVRRPSLATLISQPADCRLYEAVNVSIDQASLTGESLPVSKSVRCAILG